MNRNAVTKFHILHILDIVLDLFVIECDFERVNTIIINDFID